MLVVGSLLMDFLAHFLFSLFGEDLRYQTEFGYGFGGIIHSPIIFSSCVLFWETDSTQLCGPQWSVFGLCNPFILFQSRSTGKQLASIALAGLYNQAVLQTVPSSFSFKASLRIILNSTSGFTSSTTGPFWIFGSTWMACGSTRWGEL